jgi:hypothetical protein
VKPADAAAKAKWPDPSMVRKNGIKLEHIQYVL